jgi:hypothetical protein
LTLCAGTTQLPSALGIFPSFIRFAHKCAQHPPVTATGARPGAIHASGGSPTSIVDRMLRHHQFF